MGGRKAPLRKPGNQERGSSPGGGPDHVVLWVATLTKRISLQWGEAHTLKSQGLRENRRGGSAAGEYRSGWTGGTYTRTKPYWGRVQPRVALPGHHNFIIKNPFARQLNR